MLEIFKRLLALSDVTKANLVFLTGPDALKIEYALFMHDLEDYASIYDPGTHTGKFEKVVRKLKNNACYNFTGPMVPFLRNSTTHEKKTIFESIRRETISEHWTKVIRKGIGKI